MILISLSSCFRTNKQLRILTENYPPLSYIENGEVKGYGTDVVNAIQAELEIDFSIELMNWDAAYSSAMRHPNVVLYTIDRTPEREELFHFIGPLGSNVASLYSTKDNLMTINSLDEAKAVSTIATTTNWFTEQYLVEQDFSNLLSMVDPIQTLKLLAENKADLAVFTDVTLPELSEEAGIDLDTMVPVYELLSTDYYIAISKDTDKRIVDQWQNAFTTIQDNGTLEELHNKWFDR